MTEKTLYQKIVRPLLTSQGYMVERIEQTMLPDVWAMRGGTSLWMELKCAGKRKTGIISPDWRPGQLAWMYRCLKFGGRAILCIEVNGGVHFVTPKENYTFDELEFCRVEMR